MAVFVLDKHKRPLMPASEKRARLLLARGRAVVVRLQPFTIRLKDRIGGALQPLHLKLDPGSKATGLALVRVQAAISPATGQPIQALHILSLFQLNHRGQAIRDQLRARAGFRRRRRSQNLRYRPARFDNRRKPQGWLAPSLRHRVDSTLRLVERLRKLAPITEIVQELVRFDTQQMVNPDIAGIQYQHGTLHGFEVKEYLLLKWQHRCAYCGASGVPLEVEHITARANGGSNRLSNLTLGCRPCNQAKGARPVAEFLAHQPARLAQIQRQAQAPLHDAAAVNSTRWALYHALKATGLPVRTGSGGLTKFNRKQQGIPKTHALDAACVGPVDTLANWQVPVLVISCMGRGSYQRTRLNRYGFPRGYLLRRKAVHGFQTGDQVRAVVHQGKKAGAYRGRVAVRASGYFNITTPAGVVQGVSHQACTLIARNDGYNYHVQPKVAG